MRNSLRFLLLSLLLAAACSRPAPSSREAVPLVYDIVSGKAAAESDVFRVNNGPLSSGDIYIVGTPESCRRLCSHFLDCDIFDNVRGREFSDDLRDFAGECFSCITDKDFSPYDVLVASSGADTLRELAVRYAVAALDTRCSVSRFDIDGTASKTPAKVLILADPWLHEYGRFDVDTLFRLSSCPVSLISPQSLMMDEVLAGPRKCFNIGIICDSTYVGKGIYPSVFKSKCRQYDVVGARCFEAGVSGRPGSLYEFLGKYLESGNQEALDAILVDDWQLDVKMLERELMAVRDPNREESMNYGKLITPELGIVSSSLLTMRSCYGILRSKSLFTHRIAQPTARYYSVCKHPLEEGTHFLLIQTNDVQD